MNWKKYLGVALLVTGILAVISGCEFGNDEHTHAFGKWAVAKEPTCVDTGMQKRECLECGYTESEKLEALGHTTAKTAAVKATCTTDGLTEGTHCSVCDEVLQAQDTIPAYGHAPLKDYAVDPTCVTGGLTEGSHCGMCGAVIEEQTEIPATGHKYEKVTVVTPADCMHMGVKQFTCIWCEASYKDTYTTTEHTIVTDAAVAPTCTQNGLSQGSHCSVCNLVFAEQMEIVATGHKEVADAAQEPSCTQVGYTAGSHCSVCKAVMTPRQEIPALPHQNQESIVQPATCQQPGVKRLTCTVCGTVQEESYLLAHVTDMDLYSAAVQYVGEIITYDRNGKIFGTGIGFIISSDGKIVTNYHVIAGAFSAQITINNVTYPIDSVLAYSEKQDLAVLKVEASDLPVAKVCTEPMADGDLIYVVGPARGLTNTFAKGAVVTAVRDLDGVVYVQHDIGITSSNAGGPLMNIYGEIIGINVLSASNTYSMSLAVFASEWENLEYGEAMTMAEFYGKTTSSYQKLVDIVLSVGKEDGLGDVIIYGYASDSNGLTIYSLGYEPSTQRVYIEVSVSKDGNDTVARIYLTGDPAALEYEATFRIDRTVYNTVHGHLDALHYTAGAEMTYDTYKGMEGNEFLMMSMYQSKINAALTWLNQYLNTNVGISIADIGFLEF